MNNKNIIGKGRGQAMRPNETLGLRQETIPQKWGAQLRYLCDLLLNSDTSISKSLMSKRALGKSLICKRSLLQVVDFHDSFRYFWHVLMLGERDQPAKRAIRAPHEWDFRAFASIGAHSRFQVPFTNFRA